MRYGFAFRYAGDTLAGVLIGLVDVNTGVVTSTAILISTVEESIRVGGAACYVSMRIEAGTLIPGAWVSEWRSWVI